METKRRRGIRRYRCWLCGKDLKITTPPYQRAGCCQCEEEGLPGGWCDPPRDWSEESIEKAKQEYARTHKE